MCRYINIYVCVYLCVYIYIYVCVCVYVRNYVYVYMWYVYMYICIYVCMYMCKCICICKYVYMYMCIYVYMYMCIYVHMYVYIYICICVYMYICMCVSMHIYLFTHIILRYPDSWVSSQYHMRFQAAPHPHRHLSRSCARGAALGHQRRRPATEANQCLGHGDMLEILTMDKDKMCEYYIYIIVCIDNIGKPPFHHRERWYHI